jgi:hypothetical protein
VDVLDLRNILNPLCTTLHKDTVAQNRFMALMICSHAFNSKLPPQYDSHNDSMSALA